MSPEGAGSPGAVPDPVRIRVEVQRPYEVLVGPGATAALGSVLDALFGDAPRAVVTDERVLALHGARLGALAGAPRHVAPRGEAAKTAAELGALLDFLAGAGLDRRAFLVTFGGGALSDLGGLAASLYLRGIDVVHVPTTLLAEVDASVGGKTAINLAAGKNLAGSFWQPRAVVADTELLATLPPEELGSGLGEVLKTALLAGEELLAFVEEHAAALVAADPARLAEVAAACVRHKAAVVAADERETAGRRAELNLGHTFAHAIEHAAGYGGIPHGAAVATGVVLACEAALELGRLEDERLPERVRALAKRLGHAASLPALAAAWDVELAPAALLAGMASDKKGRGGEPRLVLPRAAGRVETGVAVERGWCGRFLKAAAHR